MSNKIEAFAKKYRKVAARNRKSEMQDPRFVQLAAEELTGNAEIDRSLVQAFRHMVNGETQHFDACVQDARNTHKGAVEAAKKAMRT